MKKSTKYYVANEKPIGISMDGKPLVIADLISLLNRGWLFVWLYGARNGSRFIESALTVIMPDGDDTGQ